MYVCMSVCIIIITIIIITIIIIIIIIITIIIIIIGYTAYKQVHTLIEDMYFFLIFDW